MSNTGGFDRTKKMIILISDVLLYHVSIYLAFSYAIKATCRIITWHMRKHESIFLFPLLY